MAYEIRQNDELIDAEAVLFRSGIGESSTAAIQSFNDSIASSAEVAEIWLLGNKDELSTELDELRYEKLTDTWILNWELVWFGWEENVEGTGRAIIEWVKTEAQGKPGLIKAIQRRSSYRPNLDFYVQLIQWAQELKAE